MQGCEPTGRLNDLLLRQNECIENEDFDYRSRSRKPGEQAEIEAQMREGYLATRTDRSLLNEEWQAIDGEGWPA